MILIVLLGDVPIEYTVPCIGVGCCSTSLYTEQPHCFGYSGKCECLCLTCQGACCKCSREPDVYCFCQKGTCIIAKMTTGCLAQHQKCCIDIRGAFPTNAETPCILNLLGLTCMYKMTCLNGFNCCMSIEHLEAKYVQLTSPTGA